MLRPVRFAFNTRFLFLSALGDRLLTQTELATERRIQSVYQQLVDSEHARLESEYRQKSDELARRWKAQLEEERHHLQRVSRSIVFLAINPTLFTGIRRPPSPDGAHTAR
jgi:hypothetical protein